MAIRSFLAFRLPDDIRRQVAAIHDELRRSGLGLRWVRPDTIHLTVVFLGDVAEDAMGPLKNAVAPVCARFAPFTAALEGVHVFGGVRNPRVLWIGLAGDTERLGAFRDALQDAVAPCGITAETRPYHPHLTLGRFRRDRGRNAQLKDILERHRTVASGQWELRELTLFKSDLKPDGAVHTPLAAWPLGG